MDRSWESRSITPEAWRTLNSREATELIVGRASELVARLVERRGHDRPPFSAEEFAPLLGVRRIETRNLGRTSALLLRFSDSYEIRLNERDGQARRNFSCAHEMGHILFSDLALDDYVKTIEYRTYNPPARAKLRARSRERLCDAAATEFLMPGAVFRKYLSTLGKTVNGIGRLASAFRVSAQAAAIRMVELSSIPCVTVLWEPWPRKRPRGFRVAWSRSNMERGGLEPRHKYVRSPSSLDRACYEDKAVKSFRLFVSGGSEVRVPVESKGFGPDDYRYVISLGFLDK